MASNTPAGTGAAGTGQAGTGAAGATAALQAALAAEDAAVFGYGVAGAHLTGTRQQAADQDWTGHSEARDALAAMIIKLGATPVAAQPYYELPFAVRDAATATELAAYLEDGVARAYLGIVAVSNQQLRGFGALAMQGPARRAAYWRGHTQAFPGLTAGLSGLCSQGKSGQCPPRQVRPAGGRPSS